MAEKAEELNLPTSSVIRIVKESVSASFSSHWCVSCYNEKPWDCQVKVTSVCLSVCSVSKLPAGIKLSKDAQTAICKAASVFVLYCTAWLVGTVQFVSACTSLSAALWRNWGLTGGCGCACAVFSTKCIGEDGSCVNGCVGLKALESVVLRLQVEGWQKIQCLASDLVGSGSGVLEMATRHLDLADTP